MKVRILLVVCWLLALGSSLVNAATSPEAILAGMSTQEKVAQLLVPAYRQGEGGTTADVTTLSEEAKALISTYPFAGVILYGENLTNNDAGAFLIHQLQQANVSSDARPQLLIMTDQEGGLVARLGHSTAGISPLALAATGQPAHTQTIATLIGSELRALGINVNLAPVADIPLDPHTDTIGLRAFGDAPDIVAAHTSAYLAGLRQTGVLNCLKHFPGLGAAAANTDGNDAPVNVDKSITQLEECELIPYRQALASDLVDMVMVNHVSYPQLEPQTFMGSDGISYSLPASLSPAIVTGLLREKLGFDGLVVADAILGTLIPRQFTPLEVIQLTLEAGVDVLPYSVELNQPSSVATFRETLEAAAAQIEAEPFLRERLDASVKRILTFKAQHGLLEPYRQTDAQAQSRAQAALQTVSNQANHDEQWSVALQAVTLVAHEDGILPLSADTQTAFVYYYASQVRSVQYALDQLIATGQLTRQQADSAKIVDVHADDLQEVLASVQVVVILSSVYYEAEFDPRSPSPYSDEIAIILPLLEQLRAQAVPVIVASCHLPYDLGFYAGRVDALLAGYLANGISTPITTPDNQPKFGAMVPALIYKLYDRQDDFHGRLPVNIPRVIDSAYSQEELAFPRGWGLTLRTPEADLPDDTGQDEADPPGDTNQDNAPSAPEITPPGVAPHSSGGCQTYPGLCLWAWASLIFATVAGKKRHPLH